MRLTIVNMDNVFNQGYHISFNDLLRQVVIKLQRINASILIVADDILFDLTFQIK